MNTQKPKVKYVKKANAWCKTSFVVEKSGEIKQKQEWFTEKPKID